MSLSRIFVYGTLMPGEVRCPAVAPFAVAWAPGTARGRVWDTGRGYPAARFDPAGGEIPGVVVEVSAGAIAVLDEVEGEGRLFRRVEVATSGGRAYGYEWLGPTEGFVLLPGGWGDRR